MLSRSPSLFRTFRYLSAAVWMCCLIAAAPAAAQTETAAPADITARVDSLNIRAQRGSFTNIQHVYDSSILALRLARQAGYQKGEGNALTALGAYYFNREKYDKALDHYFQAIDVLQSLPDLEPILKAYGQIAWMFIYTKNPAKAKNYLEIAGTIIRRTNEPRILGYYYTSVGQYYNLIKDYNAALRTFYYALYLYSRADDKLFTARMYRFIGDTWLEKKQYPQAIYNYREAVKILTVFSYQADIAIIYTRIAHVYQQINDYREVANHELMALRIREKVGQPEFITLSNIHVGAAYMRLNRPDSASLYLTRGVELARKNGRALILETAYLNMYEYMKSRGDQKEAIKYFLLSNEQHLNLIMEQNKMEISQLEASRQVTSEELRHSLLTHEQALQKLKIKNRNLKMVGVEVILVILLILIQLFYRLYRKNKQRRTELSKLNQLLEGEMKVRLETLQELRKNEALYRFLAENSSDVISRLDAVNGRNYISPSCEKVYGHTAEEVIQMRNIFELIDPEYHAQVSREFEEMVRCGKPARFTYKALRKNQPSFWVESYVNPIIDPETGALKELISVVRDITGRKHAEEAIQENARQKEILLREIHNRVKNNFAVLVSLMSMQRELIIDPELNRSLSDLQLRVRTMSLVHEQLYESQGISIIPFDEYLTHLISIVSNAYQNERIVTTTHIDPCQLPIEMVMPLGLIVNELLTNAYKYAFPSDRKGTISVLLKRVSDTEYELIIEDNGVGLPENFFSEQNRSMGMQIVHILVQQIEATLGIGSESGSRFILIFNLP